MGTGKTLTPAGSVTDGNSGQNYTVTFVNNSTGAITARPLTVTATGVNKIYDRTTAATVSLADDRVAGDVLTDSYSTATFADRNVGTSKPVSVSGISISGADATNYTLQNTTATTTADITPGSLTGSITASSKTYNGTTTATIASRTLSGCDRRRHGHLRRRHGHFL